MINSSIVFISSDTHKACAEVAYVEDNRQANRTHLERISSGEHDGLNHRTLLKSGGLRGLSYRGLNQ